MTIDMSQVRSPHRWWNKIERTLWNGVWLLLYWPSPRAFHAWRRFLLRLFGAQIGPGARAYPAARIWLPRNLTMGPHSRLSDHVDCYCVAPIRIGAHSVVSAYCYLCAASHDYTDPHFRLTTAPIDIGEGAWIAADAFIAPGVTIGEGAVVGARSSVFDDVEDWTIVAGSPASYVKDRVVDGEPPRNEPRPSQTQDA
jgi:putative colanic acid biosynthesis acetyltransferase WcaF